MDRNVVIPGDKFEANPKKKKEPPFTCDHCGRPDNGYGVHLTGEIRTHASGYRDWLWFCDWECMTAYVAPQESP